MKINKLLLALASCSIIITGCSSEKEKTSENINTSTESSVPTQAYNFTALDKNGKEVKLSDFKGKKVYINVWASWCEPCKREMPILENIYKELKNDNDFVFLSMVSSSSPEYNNANAADLDKDTILSVAEDKQISYPILFDTNNQFRLNFSVRGFPTHVFINSDGSIMDIIPGAMNEAPLKDKIKELK